MKPLTSKEVRNMFITFFKKHGHEVEPSASLVPVDDPSLLWINSGVATLKKYFDGTIKPNNPKIVLAQKSIRTNDIENVGYTARHHTFFEMLGNFSIGDYFKKEAIILAWDLLTNEEWLDLDPNRLFITVHPEDDEAYDIWKDEIGLGEDKLIRLEENYWDIGEGPSGPNTEIFYDRGPRFGDDPNDPELYPGGENERYLEIWNLVFSQFNHNPDHTYTPLPSKNIDTGLGLERMVSILQNVPTNYDTDLFIPILDKIGELSNKVYGKNEKQDIAFRIIADHVRTVTFAIADKATPSNEGRGYIIRRLIRRAVRFAKELGVNDPFMYRLVSTVGDIMKSYYPEIETEQTYIETVIKREEMKFHETLQDGLSILTTNIKNEKEKGSTVFPGDIVFKLYDTYGFPKELTEEYLLDEGFKMDHDGYEQEMEQQRTRARQAQKKANSMHVQDPVFSSLDVDTAFIGYDRGTTQTKIEKIIQDGHVHSSASKDEEIYILLKETPFYAESGGQVADVGRIYSEKATGYVQNVQKGPEGDHIHQVVVTEGTFHEKDDVKAEIDFGKRQFIIKNHSATHLLHQALKDVLGNHVNQAGSLVGPERLRFDFSHFQSLDAESLHQIEQLVNEKIWDAIPVHISEKSIEEAKAMGAMALFGEKYGDIVRVVQMDDYSIELCGGCHVQNTSEIGLFKIVSESGIGTGTRRIEAVTSRYAYFFVQDKLNVLNTAAIQLKASAEQVPDKITQLHEDMKNLQQENESMNSKLAQAEVSTLVDKAQKVNGITVLAEEVNAKDMNQLRSMVDDMKQKLGSGLILLASSQNGKVQLAAGVSKDYVEKGLHAGNLIKEAARLCGGGGGGRPDMAQAGGKKPDSIPEALRYTTEYIEQNVTD